MQSNTVTATLISDNLLKVGFDTTGNPVLGLDSFTHVINGEPKRFIYKNERGEKAGLMIDGSLTFHKNNPIDMWNLTTLQADMRIHPELASQIKIVDPEAEADAEIKAAKRLKTLLDKLLENEENSEWLSKVYRRVLNRSASGLTTKVLFRALWDKAKEKPEAFGAKTFVYDEEYFETEAILDLALERGIIIRDGDFFRNSDKSPLADSRAKLILRLKEDSAFRHFIQTGLSAPMHDKAPDDTWQVELDNDPDLAQLISGVAVPVQTAVANADGSVNTELEENKRQVELETLIETLLAANVATLDDTEGIIRVDDINEQFVNRSEFIGFLKNNPEMEKTLKEYASLQ